MKSRRRRSLLAKLIVAFTAGVGVIAAVVVIVVLLGTGGSPPASPATGAASVVPGDALAYIHLSIDPARPAVKRALALVGRFPAYPMLSAAQSARLRALFGTSGSDDFATEIRPWLGKEAALALLGRGAAVTASLIVLDVSDRPRARAFLNRARVIPAGTYAGTSLLRTPSGVQIAFVGHYLAVGPDADVRAAIDVAAGRRPSLQSSSAYQQAAAGEPPDRVLDAYASATGVQRLLATKRGLLGALGALLYRPALLGSSVSVSPPPGVSARSGASLQVRVRLHSALDPALARVGAAGSTKFEPTLQRMIPAGSPVMLDITDLARVAPGVLGAGAAAGVAGGVAPLLARLGSALGAEGVAVHDIVSLFDGETVLALAPGAPASRSRSLPPPAGSRTGGRSRAPTLVIVTRTANEALARMELAALESPLAQLFPAPTSGPGQTPEFNDRQVDGITAHQLSLAPGLEFDYAVFYGLVVVSTSLDGIAGVVEHARSLPMDPGYQATLGAHPQRVSSLLYLDFGQLLRLGAQTGLTRGPRSRAVRRDLAPIRAVGVTSTIGQSDRTTALVFQVR